MRKGNAPGSWLPAPGGQGEGIRILGVDPGMVSTGFGLIEFEAKGSLRYRESGVIRPRGNSVSPRLQQIFRRLTLLIETFRPRFMAVERPFFGKNVKSAMLLGQARGAALLAAAETGVEVQEISPLEVKQAVVGYGRAEKGQIQAMVRSILGIRQVLNADAADALAVALCLAHCLPLKVSLQEALSKESPRKGRRSARWTEKDLGGAR
ncbi:MAG: crossover junction endodeoxyribonuclease RuvC [Planctomycetaceae bacterium]